MNQAHGQISDTTALRHWKRYPAYKPSGLSWLGDVPAHWKQIRLKFLASFCGGGTPSKDKMEFWTGDIPWVSPKDMKEEHIEDTEDHVTAEAVESSATRFIPPGAVLVVVRSGILKHSIPVAINRQTVTLNQDMRAIMPKQLVRAEYLAAVIRGHQVELLSEWRKQGATVESIEFELMANSVFPIPPLDEQRRIAAFLDRETAKIDALIAKKERLIALLQEKRTALVSHAVTKGLDPNVPMKDSGVKWLGEVPAHWEVKRIKFLSTILRGKFTHRPRNDPQFYDGRYPFIQTGDIAAANKYVKEYHQTLNERGFGVSKQFPKGTLVMAIAANIGDLAILNFPACFPDSIVGFVPKAHVNLDFLYHGLSAMRQEMQSTAVLNTQLNLNVDRIGGLITVLPPFNEQQAIVRYVELQTAKIDTLITKVQQAIAKLREYRTALISAAVTGKIDVREESVR